MSMQPKAINSLSSGQTTPQGRNASAASEAVQPFGDMLSREVQNRQNAARPALPVVQPAIRERNAASQPRPASNADAAGMRARQETQRAQERHSAEERQHAQDAGNAAAIANADSSAAAAQASAQAADGAAAAGKPASDATGNDSAKDAAATTQDDTAAASQTTPSAGSAAAALQAIVASLAPKAAVPAAESAIDVPTTGNRLTAGTSALTGPAPGADDTPAAVPHDPAFDALLAQATQLSQSREAGKAAASRPSASAGDLPANPASHADNPGMPPLELGTARVSARPGNDQAGALLPAAIVAADKEALAALPGAATAGPGALQAMGANGVSGNGIDTLSPRVGTPAWDHALGQKVVWMAAGAEQSASLTLNPPDLGPIQVVINVSNAQADASFTAAQPEVRQALEAALPKLKEMLADAGLSLGQTSVGAGSPNQQGMAERQQAFGQARRPGNAGAGDATLGTVSEPTSRRNISGGNGLVNTFA